MPGNSEKRLKKELQQVIVDAAQEEIDTSFPAHDTVDTLMRTQYLRLHLVTNGFIDLAGKQILDIGCGAKASQNSVLNEERRRGDYEPWFCRFAAACGAKVTGIDRRKSEGENFRHLQSDIKNPQTLEQFDPDSFDIVNSSAFLVPPKKEATHALGMNVTAQELLDLTDSELERLDEAIIQQVTRILKDEGYFLYNERIYQKKNGELHAAPNVATLLAQMGFPAKAQRPE